MTTGRLTALREREFGGAGGRCSGTVLPSVSVSTSRGSVAPGVACSDLPASVEEVVLHFMKCVDRDPGERALRGCRIVVDHGSLPVLVVEARQHVCEESSHIAELACDVVRCLFQVAVMIRSLDAAHWLQRRGISSPSQQHPLPLDEEHVSNVARVLER